MYFFLPKLLLFFRFHHYIFYFFHSNFSTSIHNPHNKTKTIISYFVKCHNKKKISFATILFFFSFYSWHCLAHPQNPVIRRIQFGAKNILCDNKDINQLKDKKFNLNNNNNKNGVENKKEVKYGWDDWIWLDISWFCFSVSI